MKPARVYVQLAIDVDRDLYDELDNWSTEATLPAEHVAAEVAQVLGMVGHGDWTVASATGTELPT